MKGYKHRPSDSDKLLHPLIESAAERGSSYVDRAISVLDYTGYSHRA